MKTNEILELTDNEIQELFLGKSVSYKTKEKTEFFIVVGFVETMYANDKNHSITHFKADNGKNYRIASNNLDEISIFDE